MNPAAPGSGEEESSPALADEETMLISDEEEPESDGDVEMLISDEEEPESDGDVEMLISEEQEEPDQSDGDVEMLPESAAAAVFYDEGSDDGEVDVPLKVDHSHPEAFMASLTLRPLVRRISVLYSLSRDRAPRFATAGNTAGCLRVHYVPAAEDGEEDQDGGRHHQRVILVLYRYAVFDVIRVEALGGAAAVVRRSTKLHQLRFAVPEGCGAAEALRWAGPALGPTVYPAGHAGPLRRLWASWASGLRVPPRAARVHMLADVAIVRRRSYTPVRLQLLCSRALPCMMAKPWRGYHVAMELQLPEPVLRGPEEDQGEEEEKRECPCPVCLEELETGLAMWPGCFAPHVFHGKCLELSLKESDKCPVCRRRLSDHPIDG